MTIRLNPSSSPQGGIHLPATAEEMAGRAPGPGHSTGQVDTPSSERPSYVYVASSWRNTLQQGVVHTLRAAGIDCYDFKYDEGANFHWSEVDVVSGDNASTVPDYLRGLEHARALEGYASDFAAMQRADTFVLVLPCGRFAHLELGWAVGAGKRTAILLEDPCTPELMYRMVDFLAPSLFDLLGWLGVED